MPKRIYKSHFKNLPNELFFYNEDEHCQKCGYQEVSLLEGSRSCLFCGHHDDGPLPFIQLIQLAVEDLGVDSLASQLMISKPTIKLWLQGTNLPRPIIKKSLRKALSKLR